MSWNYVLKDCLVHFCFIKSVLEGETMSSNYVLRKYVLGENYMSWGDITCLGGHKYVLGYITMSWGKISMSWGYDSMSWVGLTCPGDVKVCLEELKYVFGVF